MVRDARRLRPGIGKVELLRDAALEQVEMLRQHHPGLHHVQIVDLGRIDREQGRAEQVRLLLVVALQADPVARSDDRFQQAGRVTRLDDLALRQMRAGFDAGVARLPTVLPSRHRRALLASVQARGARIQRHAGLARAD